MLGGQKKRFSLIELIVVMVLIGLVAAFGGSMIVSTVKAYKTTQENTEVLQKTQIALRRIARELSKRNADPVRVDDRTIAFDPDGDDDPHCDTIEWPGPGEPILIDSVPLTHDVADFNVSRGEQEDPFVIELTTETLSRTFTIKAYPRPRG